MALQLKHEINHRTGDYWKILRTTTDVSNNNTMVDIALYDSKEYREKLDSNELIQSKLTIQRICISGVDYTREQLYTKIKQLEGDEFNPNIFTDAEDC